MADFTIKALTPETFDDFAALVERNKGMFASCWCTHFHPACAEKSQTVEGNRALKQRLVADGIAHAALVYDGDRAVAWAGYGSLRNSPTSITEGIPGHCRAPARLSSHLHPGRTHFPRPGPGSDRTTRRRRPDRPVGGGLVEGYPHDTAGVRKKNSSFLYNGTRTMYEREGFTYTRPKGLGNCVMTREVGRAPGS